MPETESLEQNNKKTASEFVDAELKNSIRKSKAQKELTSGNDGSFFSVMGFGIVDAELK